MAAVWQDVRKDVWDLVKEKNCGPILIRLSWHDAGTYNEEDCSGGPRACMRFAGSGESVYDANKGLDVARNLLKPIKEKYASISNADFWALAAITSIEAMGGPAIPFRPGRTDAQSVEDSAEDGRLPDATKGADHLRDIFNRMGISDREIVALSGAHTVGRCRPERSGFDGFWTEEPFKFDNAFFKDLIGRKWTAHKNSAGNTQFKDNTGKNLMMLPTDMALIEDPEFKPIVEEFAESQESFFKEFAKAFQKLQESGVKGLKSAVKFAKASAETANSKATESPSKKKDGSESPSKKKDGSVSPSKKKDGSVSPSKKKDGSVSPKKNERS